MNKNYSDMIYYNTEGEVPVYQIKALKDMPFIRHGFSTRLGGVSKGIYESMNLGLYVGDDRNFVLENYARFGRTLGIDYTRISAPDQVHKSNVLVVTEEDAGDGISKDKTHFDIDAQITNVKNIPLIVYSADCVPILLVDPVSRVIGTVHAGWRGTVDGIAAKTVEKMSEVYGCLPENIHAVIGPSIGPENYEVDDAVIEAVFRCPYIDTSDDNLSSLDIYLETDNEWQSKLETGVSYSRENLFHKDIFVVCHAGTFLRDNMPENYKGTVQTHKGAAYSIFRTVRLRKKYMLNLWNLNELILVNAGLRAGNIYQTRMCTMKYHDIFFSHRYTSGKRGLNAGVIMLK